MLRPFPEAFPEKQAMSPKTHVALHVADLDASVRFYRAFLGLEPVKLKPGYAKFDVAAPPLNLTLNETGPHEAGALNHLGIEVASAAEVAAAARRLAAAGLATRTETDTDCCHALQDKVWVADPDGHRWEVFVVKVADTTPEVRTTRRADATGACCVGEPSPAGACCAPTGDCC